MAPRTQTPCRGQPVGSRVDVREEPGRFVILADLPGIEPGGDRESTWTRASSASEASAAASWCSEIFALFPDRASPGRLRFPAFKSTFHQRGTPELHRRQRPRWRIGDQYPEEGLNLLRAVSSGLENLLRQRNRAGEWRRLGGPSRRCRDRSTPESGSQSQDCGPIVEEVVMQSGLFTRYSGSSRPLGDAAD